MSWEFTNFNTDHLRALIKQCYPVILNQLSFSVLDRGRTMEKCPIGGYTVQCSGRTALCALADL